MPLTGRGILVMSGLLGSVVQHSVKVIQIQRAEAYLLAKFDLNPSNRAATIHQRYR